MQRNVTTAIILKRLNFQDADRIITCVTPDFGKITLLARGVRKSKSKLAGGIELFCENQITFIAGKKDIGTLVSARMQTNFSQIVKDVDRTMWAYEAQKIIDNHTEQRTEKAYYVILLDLLSSLNELSIELSVVKSWFLMNFLFLSGHGMNLDTDINKTSLQEDKNYQFSISDSAFFENDSGPYNSRHLKFLRLCTSQTLHVVNKINGAVNLADDVNKLLMQQIQFIH
ncbi:MAG: DNA repair protein RecO [Patescibacteria group bacterium]